MFFPSLQVLSDPPTTLATKPRVPPSSKTKQPPPKKHKIKKKNIKKEEGKPIIHKKIKLQQKTQKYGVCFVLTCPGVWCIPSLHTV